MGDAGFAYINDVLSCVRGRGESRPVKAAQSGKWYIVVDCAGCSEPIPFAEADPPVEKSDPIRCGTIANLTCPHCGHVGTYAPALMSLRQLERVPGLPQ